MSSLGAAEVSQQLTQTVPLCEVEIGTLAASECSPHQGAGLWLAGHPQTVFRLTQRFEQRTTRTRVAVSLERGPCSLWLFASWSMGQNDFGDL